MYVGVAPTLRLFFSFSYVRIGYYIELYTFPQAFVSFFSPLLYDDVDHQQRKSTYTHTRTV
jgi:hypothetical protein